MVWLYPHALGLSHGRFPCFHRLILRLSGFQMKARRERAGLSLSGALSGRRSASDVKQVSTLGHFAKIVMLTIYVPLLHIYNLQSTLLSFHVSCRVLIDMENIRLDAGVNVAPMRAPAHSHAEEFFLEHDQE
jgi:hypothetical protein